MHVKHLAPSLEHRKQLLSIQFTVLTTPIPETHSQLQTLPGHTGSLALTPHLDESIDTHYRTMLAYESGQCGTRAGQAEGTGLATELSWMPLW